MLMKAHSYFRTKLLYLKENTYRHFSFRGITVVNSKLMEHQEEENNHKFMNIDIKDEDIFSEIKKLSYFFVAPTLIYRDSYVLTPLRSTRKIIVHLINFLACIYYCKLVLTQLSFSTRTGVNR
jgi:sterol O-acyltransferase